MFVQRHTGGFDRVSLVCCAHICPFRSPVSQLCQQTNAIYRYCVTLPHCRCGYLHWLF